jgi:CubicO group peptidase (beta-lactamase class C family)
MFALLSTQALADDAQQRLAKLVSEPQVPGAAMVVGSCDAFEAYHAGIRRMGENTPINGSNRFNLGSNAKSLLATAAAVQVEAGQLSWHIQLAERFGADPETHITLQSLLNHTSGLPAYTSGEELDRLDLSGTPSEQREQFVRTVLTGFDPAQAGQVSYSNGGYVAAALLMEQHTDTAYQTLIEASVLTPLGIEAEFSDPSGPAATIGHHLQDSTLVAYEKAEPTIPSFLAPAGNVSMTASDYGRYLQWHLCGLRGQDHAVLSSEAIKQLHSPVDGTTSALGWGVDELQGANTSFHIGNTGTFTTVAALVPSKDYFIAVLSNSGVSSPAVALVLEALATQ